MCLCVVYGLVSPKSYIKKCLKDNKLLAQNMITIIDSIVNVTEETYMTI